MIRVMKFGFNIDDYARQWLKEQAAQNCGGSADAGKLNAPVQGIDVPAQTTDTISGDPVKTTRTNGS